MKRYLYLFPLMAITAATLSLSACDDKKSEETTDTTMAEPAPDTAMTAAPDGATAMAPAAVMNAEGATAYATAPGATTGAVFLTLHNSQAQADKLVGASTPVAPSVELHENAMDAQGVAQMRRVDAIEIQPGQQVSLKPDGYHIMLMGLSAPLAEGTPFDITLDFENAPNVTIPVTVTAPSADMTNSSSGPTGGTMDSTMTHDAMAPSGTADTAGTAPAPAASGEMPSDSTATTTPPSDTSTMTAPDTTMAPSSDEQPAE